MKNRFWLGAIIGLLTFAGPACAQQSAPGVVQGASLTSEAQKSETGPQKLMLAGELSGLLGMNEQYQGTFDMVSRMLSTFIVRDNPGRDEQAQKLLADINARIFSGYKDKFTGNAVVVFANAFSYDELQQMIAFFKLPVGQKLIHSYVQVLNQAMAANGDTFMAALKDMNKKVTEGLKKNGMKVPAESGAFMLKLIENLGQMGTQANQCPVTPTAVRP